MKLRKYILLSAVALSIASCDTDLVPRGQSVLGSANELEYLLNGFYVSVKPITDLGIVVNETYGGESRTVKTQINNGNTLAAAYLTYDESVNRSSLSDTDTRYTSLYKNINNLNIIIRKIDDATGDAATKARVGAEAHVFRAYMYYLAANIYAAQYDEATAASTGGIVYTTNYDVEPKPQLPLNEIWANILDDCRDEYIDLLPDTAPFNRCTRATGNAIKAKILFQMKRYADALPYALEAISLNPAIEDRRGIESSGIWTVSYTDPNNLLYIPVTHPRSAIPTYDQLTLETVALFEPGDMVTEYAYYAASVKGNPNYLAWNASYGRRDSGIDGCLEYSYGGSYANPWGITVERVMYLAAECMLRADRISDAMNLINQVRENRIHASVYAPLSASTKQEAMEILQRVKFIENLASYENFIDRKRWNTEKDYRKTITRTIPEVGTYTIAPQSPLWIMPIPAQVFLNNPNVKPNI